MSSPAAQQSKDEVYLGVWTNWSHGRTRGATLTMTRQNGGLLIAFLALFVGIAGTSFWRVGCFLIHRYLSKHAGDAVYHQRQAILRNASDSQSGLWALLHTCWAWRRYSLAPRRLFPSILFAILTFVGFIVAGTFSSAVSTSMGQEVLLKESFNCGSWHANAEKESSAELVLLGSYFSMRMASSLAYSRRCYTVNAEPRDCAVFIQPNLQYTVDLNATCPFSRKEDICLNIFRNLRVDSGYIDSHNHLGINSPPKTRILYRKVVDCAPLRTKGYTENFTFVPANESYVPKIKDDGKPPTSNDVTRYFYGRQKSAGNFTYQYPIGGIPGNAYSDYTVRTVASYVDVDGTVLTESDFAPIPALRANATDITLFFLSFNDILLSVPCKDPWYAATTKLTYEPDASMKNHIYHGDEPARVLGCVELYQFCNPGSKTNNSCTPLAGYFTAQRAANTLWQNDEQREFFKAVSHEISGLKELVYFAGISSLTARDTLSEGRQGSLLDYQWKVEVENWFKTNLADLQRVMIDYVIGAGQNGAWQKVKRPETEAARRVCQSIKIRSDAFTSFSVLGLGILLGLGGLFIIVSIMIGPLTEWVSKQSKKPKYHYFEWISNDTLQLQRLAHEELGCGTWIGENFPTTTVNETLAVLDISEPGHLKLVNPKRVNPASMTDSFSTMDAPSPLLDASADVASPTTDVRESSTEDTETSSLTANTSHLQ